MKRFGLFVSAITLASALGFLGFKMREFSNRDHEQFQTDLWRLKQMDTGFNEDVLRARFALLDNYDGFHDIQREMGQGIEALQKPPAFIDASGRAEFERARLDYAALLIRRQGLFEHFKSRNAQLANSHRYLPSALDDLAARLATVPDANRELELLINDLARLSLLRVSSPDEMPFDASARLETLNAWVARNPNHPEAHVVAGLVRHARTILTGGGEVDALTRQLLSLPTEVRIESMFRTYEGQVAKALQRSQQYRLFLFLLLFASVGVIAYSLWALRSANRHLERRVRERTAELEAEVNERISAEEKLKESLQSLAATNAVLDRACIIAKTDLSGTIMYVNDNFCRISEYVSGELLGQNHRLLKSEEHPPEFFRAMWKTIANGGIWRGEIKNRSKSGQVYWVDTTIGPMFDEKGKPRGYMAIRTDITERKRAEAQATEINRRLIETSRQAGMAEVATGVLHNVGNVLNSVNVSTNLLFDYLRKSKLPGLSKASALLQEHEPDPVPFLTSDPKGKQLPAYLVQLARHLAVEQELLLKEVDLVRKNVEHIKDIVAMQQSYAKIAGVTETVKISDLIEDAIRLNGGTALSVELMRFHQDDFVLLIDKHKALQILVNLIRNAKQACEESSNALKQVRVRASSDDTSACIEVIDNGVGILPANLTRIFQHGFTTRKNGHGFGLHSSALAARELGGHLRASSKGPGEGATFTLQLPLECLQASRSRNTELPMSPHDSCGVSSCARTHGCRSVIDRNPA